MRKMYNFIKLTKLFYPPILTSALIGFQLPEMIYQNRTNQLPYLIIFPVFYTAFNFGNIKTATFDSDGMLSFTRFLE